MNVKRKIYVRSKSTGRNGVTSNKQGTRYKEFTCDLRAISFVPCEIHNFVENKTTYRMDHKLLLYVTTLPRVPVIKFYNCTCWRENNNRCFCCSLVYSAHPSELHIYSLTFKSIIETRSFKRTLYIANTHTRYARREGVRESESTFRYAVYVRGSYEFNRYVTEVAFKSLCLKCIILYITLKDKWIVKYHKRGPVLKYRCVYCSQWIPYEYTWFTHVKRPPLCEVTDNTYKRKLSLLYK